MDELRRILEDGRSLAGEGRLDEAVDRYDRALELDPDCLLACVAKAIALMKMDMPGRALEVLEGFKIREDDPLASWAFFQKGRALYYLGRPDESISCLDMVKRSDSNYADSRFNKAVVLEDCYDVGRRRGRLEEALLCYDEAVAAKPNYPDALYNRGLLLVKLGRPEDAVESYDEAIRLAPGFAAAHDSKGSTLNLMGRHGEALSCYDEAIRLKPDFAGALYNKANSLYYLDRVEESKLLLDEAARLNPELPDHASITSMLNARLEFNRKIRGDGPPGRAGDR